MNQGNLIIACNDFPSFDPYPESILSVRHAAHRWKAHYYEITSRISSTKYQNIDISNQFWCLKNFLAYDKVLLISPDMIVNSKAPNIFEEFDSSYLLGAVKDSEIGRRPANVWMKNNVTNFIANANNDPSFLEKYVSDFDYSSYINNYINWGLMIFNPRKIYYCAIELENIIKDNLEIKTKLENEFMFSSNLFNAFFSTKNIQFLNYKWNWIAPNVAGKNGWVSDQFDPSTGELIDWEKDSDTPPDWTDNLFRGSMHPYIYHFCGTENAKEICKTYSGWR
jgi:hypothetical protein